MRIGEVAKLTGLSDSNIRFYEKKGLLAPARAQESKYRDYTQEDVETLKRILLYRKLNISIETIDALFHERISLPEALIQQENELLSQMGMLEESLNLCRMLKQEESLENEDVEFYLNYVRQEEEKGRQFADIVELLDDIESFSKTAFFDNIPYFFGLFIRHKGLARVISIGWMAVVLFLPVVMFIEAYNTDGRVSAPVYIFWGTWFLWYVAEFFRYRKMKKQSE